MNKLLVLYLLIISLTLIMCTPRTLYGKLSMYINNKTDKNIFLDIKLGSRSWNGATKITDTFIQNGDSILLTYKSIGIYKTVGISFHYIKLYNLSDTTSITFFNQNFDEPIGNIILKNSWQLYFEDKDELNQVNRLNISNDLLTLFQKDTSMLTKFKDYYNP